MKHVSQRTIPRDPACPALVETRAIIDQMDEMLLSYAGSLDPIPAFESVRFTCVQCGECCKQFVAGVSIADIRSWLDSGDHFPLAFLACHDDRHSFRVLSKKECLAILDGCSDAVQSWLRSINLDLHDADECTFLRRDRTCGIHECKPIECRLYPVGNIVLGAGDVICDPASFSNGELQASNELSSVMSVKRIVDHGIAAFLTIEGPGGTWHSLFSRLLALLVDLRTQPKPD